MRTGFIHSWWRDTRYGTLIAVYAVGTGGSGWAQFSGRYFVLVRLTSDMRFVGASVVPIVTGIDVLKAWYGPAGVVSYAVAKELARNADTRLAELFPQVEWRPTASLLATAYG